MLLAGAGAVSGLLFALSFPPADFGAVAFVAFVPLLLVLHRARGWGGAALAGASAGAAACLPAFAWVASVAVPGWLGLSVYVGLYFVVAAVAIRWVQRRHPILWPVLGAAVWAGLELCRARLGPGFPWLFLGYTQYLVPGLVQNAAWGGVYALSFLVFLVNAALAAALWGFHSAKHGRPAARHGRTLAACAGLLVLCWALGTAAAARVRWQEGPVVGVVQQNFPRRVSDIFGAKTLEELYQEIEREVDVAADLTLELQERRPVLVVWPETTLQLPLNVEPRFFVAAAQAARDAFDRENLLRQGQSLTRALSLLARTGEQVGCHLLVGGPAYLPRPGASYVSSLLYGPHVTDYGVSAFLLDPAGRRLERYDKMQLVPFGEYIPLRDALPFLQAFTPLTRQNQPGEETVIFRIPDGGGGGLRFGALICYEDVFPALVRRFRRAGADFLVNLSDEGWYWVPGELRQHLAMAVFRAVETRATVVRAANTGISCFIGPRGEIYADLPPLRAGSLAAPIRLCDQSSPYMRHGDAFGLLCLMFAVAASPIIGALRRG